MNQGNSYELYLRLKQFRHFNQKSSYTSILKEISAQRKKLHIFQETFKSSKTLLFNHIKVLSPGELAQLIKKIGQEEKQGRFLDEQ